MSGDRWDLQGVPHKGWSFVEMEDAGDATSRCEMCGNERVRYVHVMSHRTYETLRVGCVCAEKMLDDYVGPQRREREFKRKIQAKVGASDRAHDFARLASNTWWDNGKLKWSGIARRKKYFITVFQRPQGWQFRVARRNQEAEFGINSYEDVNAAFRAALKHVAMRADPEMATHIQHW